MPIHGCHLKQIIENEIILDITLILLLLFEIHDYFRNKTIWMIYSDKNLI